MSTERGERVQELRKALELTQEVLGERSKLKRDDIARIENGFNQAMSYAMHESLARGFGLAIEDMASYLRGEITVRTALLRIRALEKRAATG